MTRVKSIAARKHRIIKKSVKGFSHARKRRVKAGKEALLHAGQYTYAGRKAKRRNLKTLWIMRINAAVRQNGLTYKEFINKLKSSNIELNRKVLSEIAVKDYATLKKIIESLK